MVEKTPTTGSVETNDETKRRLAKESLDWNVKEKMFCSLFPEYVELWKEREEERKRLEAEALARGEEVVEKKKMVNHNSEGGMLGDQAVIWQFVGGIVVAIMSILFAIRFI
jgi:hypothetical protein